MLKSKDAKDWNPGDNVYIHVLPGGVHVVVTTSDDPLMDNDCVYRLGKVGKNKKLMSQESVVMGSLN